MNFLNIYSNLVFGHKLMLSLGTLYPNSRPPDPKFIITSINSMKNGVNALLH